MPRLQGIRGEDATFQVALEHFVRGQCVTRCGKWILRAHPDSSAREIWEQLLRECLILSPSKAATDFSRF